MTRKRLRTIVCTVMIAGGSIIGITGCASSASAEEVRQLDDINAEIASLQHRKSDLLDQEATLRASIDNKTSQLQQIENKLNEANGLTKE